MQQTNGPMLLRVAGRYAKDMMHLLLMDVVEEVITWLEAKYPWVTPLIDAAIDEAVADYRVCQRKEGYRE